MASISGNAWVESWQFAPVSSIANGMPRPSQIKWRLLPRLARSVGFAPVCGPQNLLAPNNYQQLHGTSRSGHPEQTNSATRAQVEIERRLDGPHWLRFPGRYLRLHHCPAPLRPSATPSGLRPPGLAEQTPRPKTKINPNTMCLQITPGGNHGTGHFYLAKNRTFLLCVDTKTDYLDLNPVDVARCLPYDAGNVLKTCRTQ